MPFVQQVTGTGALVLNGVAAGNTLIYMMSYWKNPTAGAPPATPTDSAGTFAVAIAPNDYNYTAGLGVGAAIWYEENAAAGTHTITQPSASSKNGTLIEWSGLLTSGSLDVTATAQATDAGTSQATGTTASTAQADEVAFIAMGMAADTGSTDVGFTDPVSNYTTRQKVPNDFSDVAAFHADRVLTAAGTQSATFNWTYSEAIQGRQAVIATFKVAAGGGDPLFAGAESPMAPGMMQPQTSRTRISKW